MIIAPMLKIAIPEEVASRYLCLIVHPGIIGDRGPSSLDWAIANQEKSWGVTILEAAPEFNAGPIWASHEFPLDADPPAKSSLYRGKVTEAALSGVLDALACIEAGASRSGSWWPEQLSDALSRARGRLRPPMKQTEPRHRLEARQRGGDRQENPRGRQRARRPWLSAGNKLLPFMARITRTASWGRRAKFWRDATARSASARSMARSGFPI